jgi:hypothetical protein
MKGRSPAVLVALGVLASLAVSGCSAGSSGLRGPPLQRGGSAVTYVSIDEGSLPDPRFTWQQQFYRSALPPWAVAYDISDEDFVAGSSSLQAESELIGEVTTLRPTVVTVSLGPIEIADRISAPTFAAALGRLLAALRRDAVPTVLVANVIPIPIPGRQQLVASYNSAIAVVTKLEGGVLVDVHAALLKLSSGDPAALFTHSSDGPVTVFASEGLVPRGAALFAQAFEKAMKHHPDSRR